MPLRRATNVLLVEDDPGDVVLVRDALRESRPAERISVARDGVEALECLRASASRLPDLVLLDLNLPRMDGREVLAQSGPTSA